LGSIWRRPAVKVNRRRQGAEAIDSCRQSFDTAQRHLDWGCAVKCSACAAPNPQGNRFCAACGVPLPLGCAECGHPNAPSSKFCGGCGRVLNESAPRKDPMIDAAPSPAAAHSDAQRRQLTVMFCDLVGSSGLANRLDPEQTRDMLRGFHSAVSRAVAPYDGHLAQLLGDGVLVYFGYPRAHEDDAARAVRAALAVLPAVAALPTPGRSPLQTRIGIATGLVVIGQIGQGTPAAEQSASGDTPNLAARLQALAAPGEIVLSQATQQLLDASFDLHPLGPLSVKGFEAPVQAWRALGERALASRFEAKHERAPSSLIGRDSEVALLLDRWALACEGEGQVVVLSGEAGIGKSRIGQALRERLAGQGHASVVLQCLPYFSGSALYPVVQHLKLAAGITGQDTRQTGAGPDSTAQQRQKLLNLAAPLPPEGQIALLRLIGAADERLSEEEAQMPQQQKARTLNALVELMSHLAQQQPVWLWIEDAHWIDPTTQELIAMLVDRLRDARMLTLVTTRPETTLNLGKPAHLTTLTLSRLGQRQCAALIDAVALGKSLPQDVQAEIIRKTDGVPLFVEELTKTVLQSGLLEPSGNGYRVTGPLPELAIPSTLQDSLMARLDKLDSAKEVAQAGAAIGREFARGLLAAVLQSGSATFDTKQLDKSLADLEAADLLIRRSDGSEARYSFKHALVRDTAYNSMLRTQRVLRHRQIAAALEQLEPGTIAGRPELLAYHHEAAGAARRASELWVEAGRLAVARGATREAAVAFGNALTNLEAAPQSRELVEQEIDIRIALGPVLFGLKGHSEATEASFQRALALAEGISDKRRQFQILWVLNFTNYMAGRFKEALPAARQLLELASRDDDGGEQVEAHHAMWAILVLSGRPIEAIPHLEGANALYQANRHSYLRYRYAGHDPGVCCTAWSAVTNWLTGRPERAQRDLMVLRTRIDELQHPMTNILLVVGGWLHYCLGEPGPAAEWGAELLAVARRHGFDAWAEMAIVLTELSPGKIPTSDQLRELNERLIESKSSKATRLLMFNVLVDLCAATGDVELAEQVLSPLLDVRDTMHRAEFLRLQGALLLQRATPDAASAEQSFENAIEVAREQGAKSFELRAAMSLGTLWHQQGKRTAAQELLGGVYGWFTEGFETPDLRRAKSLLDDWASAPSI
jgi:class 3 adenylate cyclase/tetratricopeptide (TPR) repeat protein